MADFPYKGLENFTSEQQRFLRSFVDSHNHVAEQANVAPVGQIPAPAKHAKISVTGGAGITDVSITDNSDSYRGKLHAFDYSFDNWQTVHTKDIGAAQNWRGNLGVGMIQVRSYARYPASAPSQPLYHPAVNTGGDVEPAMQPGQNVGYQQTPYTTVIAPKRS